MEQESDLGIITPPESAVEVANHRGVPILETASRAFTQDEIAEIKRYASAVYSFDDTSVLIQIFDLTNAENYITKGDMTVRVAVGESKN